MRGTMAMQDIHRDVKLQQEVIFARYQEGKIRMLEAELGRWVGC